MIIVASGVTATCHHRDTHSSAPKSHIYAANRPRKGGSVCFACL